MSPLDSSNFDNFWNYGSNNNPITDEDFGFGSDYSTPIDYTDYYDQFGGYA